MRVARRSIPPPARGTAPRRSVQGARATLTPTEIAGAAARQDRESTTVGILDSFERGLERAVNGAFARTFRSGLQPVEITAALRREVDTHTSPVARDRILVPNRFVVRMSEGDHIAMTALGQPLLDELTGLLTQYVAEQRYQMASPPVITLEPDDGLAIGMLEVESATERVEVEWTPVLEIDGRRYPVGPRTVHRSRHGGRHHGRGHRHQSQAPRDPLERPAGGGQGPRLDERLHPERRAAHPGDRAERLRAADRPHAHPLPARRAAAERPVSELTLLVLRVAFLALLWVFVFAVVYALRSDLFGGRVRKLPEQGRPAAAPAAGPPAVQSLPTSPVTPGAGIPVAGAERAGLAPRHHLRRQGGARDPARQRAADDRPGQRLRPADPRRLHLHPSRPPPALGLRLGGAGPRLDERDVRRRPAHRLPHAGAASACR